MSSGAQWEAILGPRESTLRSMNAYWEQFTVLPPLPYLTASLYSPCTSSSASSDERSTPSPVRTHPKTPPSPLNKSSVNERDENGQGDWPLRTSNGQSQPVDRRLSDMKAQWERTRSKRPTFVSNQLKTIQEFGTTKRTS